MFAHRNDSYSNFLADATHRGSSQSSVNGLVERRDRLLNVGSTVSNTVLCTNGEHNWTSPVDVMHPSRAAFPRQLSSVGTNVIQILVRRYEYEGMIEVKHRSVQSQDSYPVQAEDPQYATRHHDARRVSLSVDQHHRATLGASIAPRRSNRRPQRASFRRPRRVEAKGGGEVQIQICQVHIDPSQRSTGSARWTRLRRPPDRWRDADERE